jgi:hypothetical protein
VGGLFEAAAGCSRKSWRSGRYIALGAGPRSASEAAKPKVSRIGCSGSAGRVPGRRFVFMSKS